MQNLTANYNILFNANELLRQKQESYAASYIDAYDELLSVYQDTASRGVTTDKDLDAAIAKANAIISTKEQSHYVGDAYLVLGKANHLYAHYFNSVEFFRYVTLSFPKQTDLVQEARVWQVRSLLHLNQLPQAKLVLDSAINNINPKKSITGDVYATALQYYIDMADYPQAEAMAKQAIKFASIKKQRLRWTFILAQLQEVNKEPNDAYISYTGIVKSNASFEMAFNANLNRIRLEDTKANRSLTRMERLRELLHDDKNKDFTDQIYYQIALLYLSDNDIDNAVKNLHLSIRYSTKNQNQKGLSYLRLADISFKNKSDFVMAKKYYDSTLLNLSPNYPDYALIQKKSNNLQILADRLQIISHEDTLQMLASLSDKDRAAMIDLMVKKHAQQLKAAAAAAQASTDPMNNAFSGNNLAQNKSSTGGLVSNFYFYNTSAVSQGFTDFKRVWGNRKLEDNWRRSKRNSGDMTINSSNLSQGTDPNVVPNQDLRPADLVSDKNYKQYIENNIPLSPQLMDQSNKRIYNAYMDIGNFYRDILDDKKEAIEAFETMLKRFPDDPNKPAIYYNLYRLYSDIDAAKSDYYKNLILKDFPSSIYAKVILDPDYNRRLSDKDAEFNAFYNQVYDLYAHHQYKQVISKADSLLNIYPNNALSAQLLYLRVIANGHQEKLDPFKDELLHIITRYTTDRLIVPLVNQHIVYIDAHKEEMAAREFALVDNDIMEEQLIPPTVQQVAPVVQTPVKQPVLTAISPKNKTSIVISPKVTTNLPAPIKPLVITPPVSNPPVTATPPPVTTPPVTATQTVAPPVTTAPVPTATIAKVPAVASIFNMRDSTNYYFVVNVSSGTTNLSSSRFGIGQFNRANYQGRNIKHELKNAGNDNQLIYVGNFNSLNAVKDYARGIVPLLPQIMKIPADKYTFFIITKENLDKLADKKTVDSYMDFYQKNY